MSGVVLPVDFKIDNVSFTDPKKNSNGGMSILLNYNNPSTGKTGPLLIQTPRMRVPFGVDKVDPDNGVGLSKYSINLSLAGSEEKNLNNQIFTEIIRNLDDHVKGLGVNKSTDWFGKSKTLEVIEELYKSAEKKPKNTKYASTLKVKLPFRLTSNDNVQPQFSVFDENKTEVKVLVENNITLDCIEKGCEVVAIIQCTGIWFVGKTSFGLGYKVVQLKVYKNQKLKGYAIIDEDDEVEVVEEVVEEEEEED
jgi:hypothetical protein